MYHLPDSELVHIGCGIELKVDGRTAIVNTTATQIV